MLLNLIPLPISHSLARMFLQIAIYSLHVSPIVAAQYTPTPRWAQAVSLLESTLYVHGGLSDPFNSYSYSSAPEISDLLILDLSTSFNSSSPPWQIFSNTSSPPLAWHTLSAFSPTELLLFGGQPAPNSLTVIPTLNDSSGLLSTSSKSGLSLLMEPQNWANEPMRRIRHSASYANGKVWLIGGEKADGSGNAFSDHYSFSPPGREFVQLSPSSSAPPDVYGHASLVLPDGRLLVLGGYCASCSQLVPMNMVWSLSTAQRQEPVWEMLSVSNETLPSPRRDFAAVILSNGYVLVHGGGDAQLQTTYDDGWILDTTQNPMVWSRVAALSQLGPRKDHFAVQAGGYALFCFGYGSSGPASASLSVYDPTTSSMVAAYKAPSPGSMPAITSLKPPRQTGSNPNSQGGTSTGDPSGSSGTPSGSSGSSSSPGNPTTAIALGTSFGILGLIAGGLAVIYCMRRRRNRHRRTTGRFFLIADDPEFSSSQGSVAGVAPEVAHFEGQINDRSIGVGMADILAHFGVGTSRSRVLKPRRDMFADEDTRSLRLAGYSGTAPREDSEGTSVWSLRSVGALVRGMIGSEPSGSIVDQGNHEEEKTSQLLDGGQEDLIRHGSVSSHPAHGNDASFWSYTDPFEDPIPNDKCDDDLNLHSGITKKDVDGGHLVLRSGEGAELEWTEALGHQNSVWPFSVRPHTLTPLKEASHITLSEPSNSLPSLQEPPHEQTTYSHTDRSELSPLSSISPLPHSPTTSRSSDPPPVTSVSRYSIISGSTLTRSQSTSRTDSWWSRLTKPPLLDRRTSLTASKPLDFRDPTPAPPLITLEDTKESSSTPMHPNNEPTDIPADHGRSLSSTHSGRTANTDSAEYLGARYDVVQRLASDGSSSRRAPSLGSAEITEQGMLVNAHSEIPMSSGLHDVDPPRSAVIASDPAKLLDVVDAPLPSPKSTPTSPKRGVVSNRIKAYEHRMSQELELQQIPAPRNTRRREEVPSRSRPTIQYGVVPRPSLFLANPDLGHIS